jgi:hypothetical protein
VTFSEFEETEVDRKRILTQRCTIREGTRFFLRVPKSLILVQKGVAFQFLWKTGEETWDVPHNNKLIQAGDLPYRHKSKPINRMINYARSSEGFRWEDSKLLLRLLAEDFWCSVGWYPQGWMLCEAPYISIDLRSMDKHMGRHVIDNAIGHPFLERT